MALAVLVGLIVTVTFMPAVLATVGRALLWPTSARAPSHRRTGTGWLDRLIVMAVRKPRRTLLASLGILAVMSSGLVWLEVGNPLIRGVPESSEPRVAYDELRRGFAPGVLAPSTLVVTPRVSG